MGSQAHGWKKRCEERGGDGYRADDAEVEPGNDERRDVGAGVKELLAEVQGHPGGGNAEEDADATGRQGDHQGFGKNQVSGLPAGHAAGSQHGKFPLDANGSLLLHRWPFQAGRPLAAAKSPDQEVAARTERGCPCFIMKTCRSGCRDACE